MPELQDIVVGVNCIFNEVIPEYTEEYFHELNKMQLEMVKEPSMVENFVHLVGVKYLDDESNLEFITTRIIVQKGLIVGFRAPVLHGGKIGNEEKSPIHIADIVRMCGMSASSPTTGPDQPKIRGILKLGVPLAGKAMGLNKPKGDSPTKGRVRFELQESDQSGHEGSRKMAGGHNSSAAKFDSSDSTMRSAHDTNSQSQIRSQDNSVLQNTTSDSNRSVWPAHAKVHDAALRQKSTK